MGVGSSVRSGEFPERDYGTTVSPVLYYDRGFRIVVDCRCFDIKPGDVCFDITSDCREEKLRLPEDQYMAA